MTSYRPAVVLASLLCVTVPAQTNPPGLGDLPAPLQVTEVLNAPPDAVHSFAAHRGKVVVLEFFAIWCGPCVAGLPKVNALVESLDPEHYQWWMVTTQPSEALAKFMETHRMVPPVLIDGGGRTTEGVSPAGYPLALVIGPDGRIAARLHPADLTTELLARIRAGERIESPYVGPRIGGDLRWDEEVFVDGLGESAFAQAVLQRSKADIARELFDPEHGRIVADGCSLARLVAIAHGAEIDHVELSGFEDGDRYRISIRAADEQLSTARRMLRDLLTASFGLTTEVTLFQQERVVLERIPGSTKKPPIDEFQGRGGGSWTADGVVDCRAVGMGFLSHVIAHEVFGVSTRVALDLTGLTGSYRIAFRYDPSDTETLRHALAEMGLRFEKREVERQRVRCEKLQASRR